tara:strand:+ start:3364 stop:3951 length:588 start_codon:yes stop_codon:yes gene_type:complete
MTNLIQAAVPGQSLTDSPKNPPWERPAEMSSLEDVVTHYVTRLADESVMDDMAMVFKLGADLETVVETIHTAGAMKGMHTVEAGMLAGPVIASFLKSMLATYDIDAPERSVDPDTQMEEREHMRISTLLDAAMAQAKEEDSGTELLQEMSDAASQVEGEDAAPMPEMPVEQEEGTMAMAEPMADQGNGIMSRGAV